MKAMDSFKGNAHPSSKPAIAALIAALVAGAGGAAWAQGPNPVQPTPLPGGSASAALSSAPVSSAAPQPSASSPAKPAVADAPKIHHAPIATAKAHEDLQIQARIDRADQVRQATLVYRNAGGTIREAAFERTLQGPYAAIIPGTEMLGPSIGYTIEVQDTSGQRFSVFASRQAMHVVQVPDELADLREKALAQRLGNRRSVVTASGEYVSFGGQNTLVTRDGGATENKEFVPDQYWRAEAAYTYRPLTWIAEFGMRAGVVRGTSIVPETKDRSKYDVGLNYASPSVRFRLHDSWHVDGSFLLSVTEVGFSVGAGGALIIGDPSGTNLTFGAEAIQTFGTRFYSRMNILAHDRVQVAPIIEVTDMPHADRYGVRLLGEMRFDLGAGFMLGVRGGYQARVSTSGGFTAGGTLGYAF
jgi:hypothetical protein